MIRFMAAVPVIVAALTVFTFAPGLASAHEQREVGNYIFEVGWATEPPAVESPNSLSLKIVAKGTEEGVIGLEESLQAEVIVGGGAQTGELRLEPSGEEPGVYGSPIIPTREGDYTFRIFGTIDGQSVDESFSSGPETFDTVEILNDIQFPDQVPTNGELAAQIAAIDTGGGNSDTATILAIVGIVAGVIGIGVGGFALARRRG